MSSRINAIRAGARAGFTLTEVIIALVIIGVLGAIVGFNMIGIVGDAKAKATKASMDKVQGALKMYYAETSVYPTSLQALVDKKLLEELPKDGWGNLMGYYSPTTSYAYELISAGADGIPQTPDDINTHPVDPNSPVAP